MKNTQRGFSLAEVLIATAIAAIIATIGFTIAKKGVARAYNLYVYAGYYGMYQAIADATSGKGFQIQSCGNNLSTSSCDFTKHIYSILSGRDEHVVTNGIEFTTPNKIKYKIYYYGKRPVELEQDIGTQELNPDGTPMTNPDGTAVKNVAEYRIMMKVPSAKTKTSSTKSICMSYQPDSAYKYLLIPFANDANDGNCSQSDAINDIATRKDLLAFYLDDGLRGRKIEGTYRPRYFRNALQAFCRVFDNKILGGSASGSKVNLINCSNNDLQDSDYETFEVKNDPTSIIIKVTDPRRI